LIAGADSYDPFADNLKENVKGALALLEAQRRIASQKSTSLPVIISGNIILSPSRRKVFVNEIEVNLTKTEFDLLELLVNRRGCVLPYNEIYCCSWQSVYNESANNAVKSVIKRLRKKITGVSDSDTFIESVRGVGYRLPANFEG
jgi:DNA-binding response OmpR family regulator